MCSTEPINSITSMRPQKYKEYFHSVTRNHSVPKNAARYPSIKYTSGFNCIITTSFGKSESIDSGHSTPDKYSSMRSSELSTRCTSRISVDSVDVISANEYNSTKDAKLNK